jgi:hypothetical protein
LSDFGIDLALLGYGIPGFLLGPLVGERLTGGGGCGLYRLELGSQHSQRLF